MKRNHTLALISILAAGLSLVPSSNLLRTRASGVAALAQGNGDIRGFLGRLVTARAAGRGNPWVTLRDGYDAPAQYQGSSKLVQQLKDNQTRPLSVGSADFDEDGVPDIVAGYAGTKDGVISVQRGDTDTIFPNTREAIAHRAQSRAAADLPRLRTKAARDGHEVWHTNAMVAEDFLGDALVLAQRESGGAATRERQPMHFKE